MKTNNLLILATLLITSCKDSDPPYYFNNNSNLLTTQHISRSTTSSSESLFNLGTKTFNWETALNYIYNNYNITEVSFNSEYQLLARFNSSDSNIVECWQKYIHLTNLTTNKEFDYYATLIPLAEYYNSCKNFDLNKYQIFGDKSNFYGYEILLNKTSESIIQVRFILNGNIVECANIFKSDVNSEQSNRIINILKNIEITKIKSNTLLYLYEDEEDDEYNLDKKDLWEEIEEDDIDDHPDEWDGIIMDDNDSDCADYFYLSENNYILYKPYLITSYNISYSVYSSVCTSITYCLLNNNIDSSPLNIYNTIHNIYGDININDYYISNTNYETSIKHYLNGNFISDIKSAIDNKNPCIALYNHSDGTKCAFIIGYQDNFAIYYSPYYIGSFLKRPLSDFYSIYEITSVK